MNFLNQDLGLLGKAAQRSVDSVLLFASYIVFAMALFAMFRENILPWIQMKLCSLKSNGNGNGKRNSV
jgi:hypothetical protein